MPTKALASALAAVDWNSNANEFLTDALTCEKIASCNMSLALWAHQIEQEEVGNPALSFLREMQISGQHVAALCALALYKPAAASMRTVVESCLYYSYFRTHPSELATLVRSSKYFTDKHSILEYHKEHTPNFSDKQQALGLISLLNPWYSEVSAIVHGQIPGSWTGPTELAKTKQEETARSKTAEMFDRGVKIVNFTILSTFADEIWHAVSPTSKGLFLKGLSGPQKAILGLDGA